MVSTTGGDKFEGALRKIAGKLSNASVVKVGFPENAEEPNGTLVSLTAAIQEFGAPSRGIPPRPFMRNTVSKYSGGWPSELEAALIATDYDAAKALAQLGSVIAGQVQQSIIDMNAPPLSAVTNMLRGMRSQSRYSDKPFGELIGEAVRRVQAGKTNYGASTKPLVDSGTLLSNVNFQVD